MSALAILAIVAGALLAAVFAVGAATAVKARVMRNRDLVLAEALAGEKPPPPPPPRVRRRSRVTKEADKQRSILEEAAIWRSILERAASRWDEHPEQQSSLTEEAARHPEEHPGEWRSLINDLIREKRWPHAGVLLLSAEPALTVLNREDERNLPDERDLADAVTWYRDQLLSLHPAYLAIDASLLERVTQLITLTIRMEHAGEIPNRRPGYPRNRR